MTDVSTSIETKDKDQNARRKILSRQLKWNTTMTRVTIVKWVMPTLPSFIFPLRFWIVKTNPHLHRKGRKKKTRGRNEKEELHARAPKRMSS